MEKTTYRFDLPTHHQSIIKVIGVGGGGSNAVNNMYNRGIKDVSFAVCNTDAQALEHSPIQHKLQLGIHLTGGLGAGANPEVGKNAALESKDDIKALLSDATRMVFITAGMGGGTGTGAAPVIAEIAKKMGILTVGIVTQPFAFEGKKKLEQAQEGIKQLRQHCDTVLVILNDRLRSVLGNLSVGNAFAQADNVLTTAAKSIAEIITVPGYVNVDFEDVKTVMKDAGAAVMGSGQATGEERALKAAEAALASPLLDYQDIHGAKRILLSIVSGKEAELQMDELTIITDYIQDQIGTDAEMIFGHGSDTQLEEHIRVTGPVYNATPRPTDISFWKIRPTAYRCTALHVFQGHYGGSRKDTQKGNSRVNRYFAIIRCPRTEETTLVSQNTGKGRCLRDEAREGVE
jgi:cell division protein FtsZ